MARGRSILLIEDDVTLLQTLVEQFRAEGEFAPVAVRRLAEAERHLTAAEARFDLVVLDLALPDGDGRIFCAALRRRGLRIPVIMLTGSCGEANIVAGLSAGASDYITKPFRMAELLARMRAQLRLYDSNEHAPRRFGPFRFFPALRQLEDSRCGARYRLTEKETAILKYLLEAGGRTVPRQRLLDEVWGYNSRVTTHTLETHIYRLRRKIESTATAPRFLLTESGGYRFDPQPPLTEEEGEIPHRD